MEYKSQFGHGLTTEQRGKMKFELKIKDHTEEGQELDNITYLVDCHGMPRVGDEVYLYEEDLEIRCVALRVCWPVKVASGVDVAQPVTLPLVEAKIC